MYFCVYGVLIDLIIILVIKKWCIHTYKHTYTQVTDKHTHTNLGMRDM